jgi:hypothetical protein
VADVDRDGQAEVLTGAADGKVCVLRANGTALPGWPREAGGLVTGGGSLGDPDRDGRLEVAVGTQNQRLYCWDFGPGSYDATRLAWPTARGSFQRQGTRRIPAIGVEPGPAPGALSLAVSPNPARGSGEVRLAAPAQAGEAVRFELFDARGRLVRSADRRFGASGVAVWRIQAGGSAPAAAGVYFVRAQARGMTARTKWVLLR